MHSGSGFSVGMLVLPADGMLWFTALDIYSILLSGSLKAPQGTLATDSFSAMEPPDSHCLRGKAALAAVEYFATLSPRKAGHLLARGLQWDTEAQTMVPTELAKVTLFSILKCFLKI